MGFEGPLGQYGDRRRSAPHLLPLGAQVNECAPQADVFGWLIG